ncbi:hypothetical protein VULLAG_LOCUS6168 [Vulpes lagopus]
MGGSCSPRRPRGAAEGARQVREPLPGWKGKGGLRVCSQAGGRRRPRRRPPNPPERPGRRRVCGRKRPETARFHAASGLGFQGSVDGLRGRKGPGETEAPERAARAFLTNTHGEKHSHSGSPPPPVTQPAGEVE